MSGLELFVASSGIEHQMISVCLKPKIPFVLTSTLAHEIRIFQNKLAEKYYRSPWESPMYVCWHLHAGKIKWKGLDFNFILNMLKSNNNADLLRYIDEVFDLLFLNYVSLGVPIINCSILNRPTRGISQDFFFLNQLNFIKNPKNGNHTPSKNIVQIDIDTYTKKLSFPRTIYARNTYYEFHIMNISLMNKVLDSYTFKAISKSDLPEIQLIFDKLKDSTMNTIFQMASSNLKLIERLAYLQVKRRIT